MNIRVAIIEDSLPFGEGVGTYSRHLVEGLRQYPIDVSLISLSKQRSVLKDSLNHSLRLSYRVLTQTGGCHLLHATSAVTGLPLFLSRKRKLITWHDLITILCPDSGGPSHVKLVGPALFRFIALGTNRIAVVSNQTRDELINYLHVPAQKISVISLGVDQRFKPLDRGPRQGLTVGYVGSFMRRKRVDYSVRAFHYLRKRHPELHVRMTIWGNQDREYPRVHAMVDELGLSNYVSFPGFAPEEKLPDIYNSMDAFIFPSEWEGFGLPVLEAQKCGVPVVIRKAAHISPEVGAQCIKADSEEDMADRIWQVLTDIAFRKNAIEQGLKHSRRFTWGRTVEQTVEVYRELAQSGTATNRGQGT